MADEKKKNPYASAFIMPWNEQPHEPAPGPSATPVVAPTADQATAETPITTTAPSATDNSVLAPKVQNAPALPEFDVNASALELNKALTEYITNNPRKTKDELEKEERRERIAAGIRALGGMATAFSNLAYTGQGAPSQTLAKFDDGEARIDKWRARNDKLWNDYLGAQKLREQLMRQRIADARYEREFQNRVLQQNITNKHNAAMLKQRQDELDYKRHRDDVLDDRYNDEFAHKKDMDAEAAAARRQGNAIAAENANTHRREAEYRMEHGYYTGGGGRNNYIRINDGEGGYYNLPKSDMNDETVADLASYLGIETTTGEGRLAKPKTRSQLMNEIGRAVQGDQMARNRMREWAEMNGYEAEGRQREENPMGSTQKKGKGKEANPMS